MHITLAYDLTILILICCYHVLLIAKVTLDLAYILIYLCIRLHHSLMVIQLNLQMLYQIVGSMIIMNVRSILVASLHSSRQLVSVDVEYAVIGWPLT